MNTRMQNYCLHMYCEFLLHSILQTMMAWELSQALTQIAHKTYHSSMLSQANSPMTLRPPVLL